MTMARSTRVLGENLLLATRPRPVLRWLRLLVPVALCSGAGAAWAFRNPASYRAETTIEYAQDPALIAKGDALGSVLLTDEWYNTQDFLLRGRSVADAVALELKLNSQRGFFGARARDPFHKTVSDAALRIGEELEVARVPK